MPWQETTLDLQFEQADKTTWLQLTSSQQLTVILPNVKKDLDYTRAFKLDDAACDFRSEMTTLPKCGIPVVV